MSFSISQGAGAGRLGFFVLSLAMYDGGGRFAGIFADPLPNTHHVPAGRVHDLAAAILDLLLNRQFGSKRPNDDDIVWAKIGDVRLFVSTGQVLDAQRRNLLVDLRIVNDFADNEEAT